MPIIPELSEAEGSYRPAVGSPETAAMPARARQSIAQGIGDIADAVDTFQGVRAKVQRMEDNRADNEASLIWQKAMADHEAFRLENRDESKWSGDLQGHVKTAREQIGKLPMSPEARQNLDQAVKGWEIEAGRKTTAAELTQRSQRSRQSLTNATEADMRGGNFGNARERIKQGVAAGVLLPEEGDDRLLDIDKEEADWKVEQANKVQLQEITEDPAEWLQKNPANTLPEGTDPATYANQQNFARGVLRTVTRERLEAIQDGMANGKIRTPEQIDEYGFGLRPAVLEEAKMELARRAQLGEQERRSTPEYQNQAIGRAASLIRDWRRDADDFDEGYAQIYTLISQVEDPGAKKALMDQLQESSDGQKRTLDTQLKLAEEAVTDAFKAGRFGEIDGTGRAEWKTRTAEDSGILLDRGKLLLFGFSEEQANKIADGDLKPVERKQLFRTMFIQRAGPEQQGLLPFDRAAFNAIRNGDVDFETFDPEMEDAAITARTQAEERFGAALTQLKKLARTNPNATKTDFENEVYLIAGEDARTKLKSMTLSARPSTIGGEAGPKGAFSGISAVPVGKDLKAMVRHFEAGGAADGFHPQAYWDYGQWSIGYGTKAKQGETITREEAESRLDSELTMHRQRVEKAASAVGMKLEAHELDALTSFDYNTGEIERLLAGGKRSKAEVAETMLLYRNAKGQRLPGLVRRRQAERHLFLNGYDQ